MRRSLFALLSLVTLGCSLAAHADVVPGSYTLVDGYAADLFVGTVTLNSSGAVVGGSLTDVDRNFGSGDLVFSFDLGGIDGTLIDADFYNAASNGNVYIYFEAVQNGAGQIPLCLYTNNVCPNYAIEDSNIYIPDIAADNFTSGYLAPTTLSATPEPSSLVLLGTGVLGVAGAARRRFLKR